LAGIDSAVAELARDCVDVVGPHTITVDQYALTLAVFVVLEGGDGERFEGVHQTRSDA
jgi:hypothetical protein